VYSVSTIAAAWYNERVVVVCDVSDDFVCLIERQTRCSYACKADEIIIIIEKKCISNNNNKIKASVHNYRGRGELNIFIYIYVIVYNDRGAGEGRRAYTQSIIIRQ